MTTNYADLIDEISHDNMLVDAEDPIIVNGLKRTCDISDSFNREVAIVGDHRSNLITFHSDRIIDGHDTLECTLAVIKWENLGAKTSGAYTIDDRAVLESDPSKVIFHWAIESDTTTAAGKIRFSLCFIDYNEAGNQVTYRWNARPCAELSVGEGIYNADVDTPVTNNDGGFIYNGAISIL